MPTIERARAKHNEIVALLGKVSTRRDKAIDALVRIERKRLRLIRSVARSQKRLDKLAAIAQVSAPLPDPKDTVSLADLGKTEQGKANAESWNAIPAVKRAKPPISDVTDIPVTEFPIADRLDDDMPEFLRRDASQDKAAAEKLKAEIAEQKALKARGRAAARNARARGDTKRMPLQGKAALDYINRV